MAVMRDSGLSAGTIANVRTILRRALEEAERRGHVARNVAQLTRAPKRTGAKLDDGLDAAEAVVVLAAARGRPS